eukprot:GHVP01066877.1.p1 GENE.GHVP01066877.1~~GHVP01066877.1.p1  ORF type:complete len:433 (-),score=57.12 GHVP01066877.1:268-1566(-)
MSERDLDILYLALKTKGSEYNTGKLLEKYINNNNIETIIQSRILEFAVLCIIENKKSDIFTPFERSFLTILENSELTFTKRTQSIFQNYILIVSKILKFIDKESLNIISCIYLKILLSNPSLINLDIAEILDCFWVFFNNKETNDISIQIMTEFLKWFDDAENILIKIFENKINNLSSIDKLHIFTLLDIFCNHSNICVKKCNNLYRIYSEQAIPTLDDALIMITLTRHQNLKIAAIDYIFLESTSLYDSFIMSASENMQTILLLLEVLSNVYPLCILKGISFSTVKGIIQQQTTHLLTGRMLAKNMNLFENYEESLYTVERIKHLENLEKRYNISNKTGYILGIILEGSFMSFIKYISSNQKMIIKYFLPLLDIEKVKEDKTTVINFMFFIVNFYENTMLNEEEKKTIEKLFLASLATIQKIEYDSLPFGC